MIIADYADAAAVTFDADAFDAIISAFAAIRHAAPLLFSDTLIDADATMMLMPCHYFDCAIICCLRYAAATCCFTRRARLPLCAAVTPCRRYCALAQHTAICCRC